MLLGLPELLDSLTNDFNISFDLLNEAISKLIQGHDGADAIMGEWATDLPITENHHVIEKGELKDIDKWIRAKLKEVNNS